MHFVCMLVASPFFLFIEKSFHVYRCVRERENKRILYHYNLIVLIYIFLF